jgi:hypothetical protein
VRGRTRWVVLLGSATGVAAAASSACSSDSSAPPGSVTDGAAPTPVIDASTPGDAGTSPDAAAPTDGGGTGSATTFTYHPSWSGVTSASVWGQFGTSTDWTAAFLVLTPDGQGGFTGSATLPPGSYPYILQATGDAASSDAGAALSRYAVDPTNPAITACPAASPTYDATASNPCSVLAVPTTGAAVLHHVRGTVTGAGAPAAGWLVQIERNEGSYHHFFADRTTVGPDGTFDLAVAAGGYQLFVLNPTFLSVPDADQKPEMVKTYRREESTAFTVSGDIDALPPSVDYDGYAAMDPRGDAGVLPTTFSFTSAPLGTHLAVYNGKPDTIGDPWYTAPAVGGTASFDGMFNTKQAGDAGFVHGARYFWGTDDTLGIDGHSRDAGDDSGALQWTGQTLVYPVVWP